MASPKHVKPREVDLRRSGTAFAAAGALAPPGRGVLGCVLLAVDGANPSGEQYVHLSLDRRGMRASVSGTPQWLLNDLSLA